MKNCEKAGINRKDAYLSEQRKANVMKRSIRVFRLSRTPVLTASDRRGHYVIPIQFKQLIPE